MSRLKVLPYKAFSESAKAIVASLNPKAVLKRLNSPLKGKKILLNWGNSSPAFNLSGVTVLNKPVAVQIASNKLLALSAMEAAGVSIPEYTTDINVARTWIQDDERFVVCRKLLRANSGRGIVLAKSTDQLVSAPLYTKYVRKGVEYRLHVFRGEVIDAVQKKRRQGYNEQTPGFDKYIRSYEKGWVMVREGVTIPESVKTECIKAVRALGLDFAAVDVVLSSYNNKAYVLECNTAPGIQGKTVESYKKAITKWLTTVG